MNRLARFRSLRGFTLIEILVVIVIIGVLSIMGVSKYTEFTTTSRQQACISNQATIDKTVAVWESQNVAIPNPPSAQSDLTFNTNGDITASSGVFPGLAAPATAKLDTTAKTSVYKFTKDPNVFCCPERANIAGGIGNLHSALENDYTFRVDTANSTTLNNKSRGAFCINFGGTKNGPDGTTNTTHK